MNVQIRKILYIFCWYLVYPQVWYHWLTPELFSDHKLRLMLAAILISYVIGIMDTILRPFSEDIRGDLKANPIYSYTMLGLFLLNPLFVVATLWERAWITQFLPSWDSPLVSFVGIVLLVVGGAMTVAGRAQLGRFGSGVLHIEDGHRLVTMGIYRLVRHPIYGGGIIGVVGIYLAFNSLIMLLVVTSVYFLVIKHRLLFEERMLLKEFGNEYEAYMKRTRQLIPFVY